MGNIKRAGEKLTSSAKIDSSGIPGPVIQQVVALFLVAGLIALVENFSETGAWILTVTILLSIAMLNSKNLYQFKILFT
jgi:hypothetical protein